MAIAASSRPTTSDSPSRGNSTRSPSGRSQTSVAVRAHGSARRAARGATAGPSLSIRVASVAAACW